MKILIRQPMTWDWWPDIIVQSGTTYSMVSLRFVSGEHYPDLSDLDWNAPREAMRHAISGYLVVEFGSELARDYRGRLYLPRESRTDAYYQPDFPRGEDPIAFTSFWDAKVWFEGLDPIPLIMKVML